jgi:GH25 family lysozyme M1 (1,4-beta-N-acetylmuramidase)
MIIKNPLVVDVSTYNRKINWPLAKSAGVRAGIAKASQNFLREDDQFRNNWQPMLDAGVPRGAYHFYNWWASSGSQAKKFVSVIKKYGGVKPNDVLALDDEEEGKMSLKSMIDFTYNVEMSLGIRCIWYSWARVLNGLSTKKLTSYQLGYLRTIKVWSAGYPYNPDLYPSPPSCYIADKTKYGNTVLWQYHPDVPNIQGIPGGTDVNWVDPEFLYKWEMGVGYA